MAYAGYGWRVLPGARWNGTKYFRPDSGLRVPGLLPVVPRTEATSRHSQIERWWTAAPFSVLLAAGCGFAAISVPAELGVAAARFSVFRDAPTPTLVHPEGRILFLIEPIPALRLELRSFRSVFLLKPGAVFPAPPTTTGVGPVRWWFPPDACPIMLGSSRVVQEALCQAISAVRWSRAST
ncbi:hypothetical protein FHR81_004940 [Actinoalloteichus hoggarensis]|uniref:bifunctional DNA primase/polymerase n=1 Tax=Actinoalloteichus hoggarensis TaxID=1470176 RepID=UPI0012FD650F|nr:bifunctional DNA primase/polymerase [Actinoalloteichus hoggarensis]MBB5923867.1 hypothetical protein [Actinoalloteichus hoggarensis]